ncbi:MAG: hypothetical protein WA733_24975 [Methylocystis sp.]
MASAQPGSPERGRLPTAPRRKDACAIAVASSGTGASQSSRCAKAKVRQPKRENLGVGGRRVRKKLHRCGAGAYSRGERMLSPGEDVPQGVGDPLEAYVAREVQKIGGGAQGRRIEPQRPRGEERHRR